MTRRILLLFAVLGFGSVVETAWQIRRGAERIDMGPHGCVVGNRQFAGPSFSFESSIPLTVPAGGTVEVENAFGAVRIGTGVTGEAKATLRKVVYREKETDARAFADRIQLQAAPQGPALVLSTNRGTLEKTGENVSFETHLDLVVPAGTSVRVRNEHGRVEVRDVARAEIVASFEGVDVQRVAGPVEVESRHADVLVSDVKGPLSVTSMHGNVEIRDVPEAVKADVQHGELAVSRVGSLSLEHQHGDLKADSVKGELRVRSQHSAVTAVDVGGLADVETSYEAIRLSRMAGDVRASTRHGGIEAEDVKGALTAEAAYDGVEVTRMEGPVDISVSGGAVTARTLAKGARVHASGDPVTIMDFRGVIDVQAEHADVVLAPGTAVVEPVSVTTRNGSIRVEVPVGSRFHLEASSRNGEVEARVPALQITRVEDTHVSGTLGGGGVEVKLEAESGNVELVDAGPATAAAEPKSATAAAEPKSATATAAKPASAEAAAKPAGAKPAASATSKTDAKATATPASSPSAKPSAKPEDEDPSSER